MEFHLEQGIVLDDCKLPHFTCVNMHAYSSSFRYRNSKEPQLNHKGQKVNMAMKKAFNTVQPDVDSTVV